jgi:hypothetical protein
MTRTLLTAIFLTLFSQTAWANLSDLIKCSQLMPSEELQNGWKCSDGSIYESIASLKPVAQCFKNVADEGSVFDSLPIGQLAELGKNNVVAVAVSKLDVQYAIKNFGSIPENTNCGVKSSVVASILDSQAVEVSVPSDNPMKKSVLAKKIAQGTYYLSCFMTIAQINKLQSQKVMFENIK